MLQSWRAIRRGDPIKSTYLRNLIYPGDFQYKFYLINFWGIAGALLFVVAPIALLVLVALVLKYWP